MSYQKFVRILILAVILIGIVFGSWIRITNLSHVGFEFDIITTQYTWGKTAYEWGVFNFWQNYADYFDYLPGALYLDTFVYAISRLFSGTPEAFAFVLKSFNWLVEISFSGLIFYLARRYGSYSRVQAGVFAVLAYVLPSFWFISSVWGQIDSFVVVLSIVSLLLLTFDYKEHEHIFRNTSFWSGVFFGLAVWTKMQPVLLIPVIILYFLSDRNSKKIKAMLFGFGVISIVILAIPIFANANRLGYVVGAPFLRENVVSRSAATFWTLTRITQRDYLNQGFHPETMFRIISLSGLVLYAIFSATPVFLLLKTKVSQLFTVVKNISTAVQEIFYRRITTQEMLLIATISTIAYFEFMTKMYARYLHFGTMLAIAMLVTLKYKKPTIVAFVAALMLNLGNFINVLGVYVWWGYIQPVWLTDWFEHWLVNKDTVSVLLTLSALFIFILVARIYSNVRAVSTPGKFDETFVEHS